MKRESDVPTGVILAGGLSRRMGYDKRTLHVGEKTLFEYVLMQMGALCPELLVIANDPEFFAPFDVQVVPDIYPGSSLGGLYTGLYHSPAEVVFASACDLPFFNLDLARVLLDSVHTMDASLIKTADGYEPLFACYRKTCLPWMRTHLEQGNYRIQDLILKLEEHLNVRKIDIENLRHIADIDSAFVNVNHPGDLEQIGKMFAPE
ncbi:MAG: molybdenum cofactor guanylyltransferase [Desulfuromonadaceae bacterium]